MSMIHGFQEVNVPDLLPVPVEIYEHVFRIILNAGVEQGKVDDYVRAVRNVSGICDIPSHGPGVDKGASGR